MKTCRVKSFSIKVTAFILLGIFPLKAQIGCGHILFGDPKIDQCNIPGPKAQSYEIVVYSMSGPMAARRTIPNNGRYRFLYVRNGKYDMVAAAEGQEVAKIHLLLQEKAKAEIRRDLELAGQPDTKERKKIEDYIRSNKKS